MISSLIEMLQLQNFGHMTTSTIQFVSRDKFCDVRERNYDITFNSKNLYFLKVWSNHFANIIKIVTMFIKTIFKD